MQLVFKEMYLLTVSVLKFYFSFSGNTNFLLAKPFFTISPQGPYGDDLKKNTPHLPSTQNDEASSAMR